MNFLNSGEGYVLYEYEAQKDSYVDKSMLISSVYGYARKTNKYICVARPRRFGKSTAANMIAAFYDSSKAEESGRLFETLNIGKRKNGVRPDCWELQGKANVIRINMIDVISEKTKSYDDFIQVLSNALVEDISEAYPALQIDRNSSISMLLKKTGKEFVFVIDAGEFKVCKAK